MFEAAKKRMEERQKEQAERKRKRAERAKAKLELKKAKSELNKKLWAQARKECGNGNDEEAKKLFKQLQNDNSLTN